MEPEANETEVATNGMVNIDLGNGSPPTPADGKVEVIEMRSKADGDGGDGKGKTSKENNSKENRGKHRYMGIGLASLAAIMFSLSALIVKYLNYEPCNFAVWRFSMVALLSIPFFIHGQFCRRQHSDKKNQEEPASVEGDAASNSPSPVPVKPDDGEDDDDGGDGILHRVWPPNQTTGCLLLQAILGSNSVLFIFFGVEYLHVADAIVIATSAPVFVTFAAWIYLRERCGIVPVVLAVLALLGVATICKPPLLTGGTPLNKDTFMGVSFSFASMILLTGSYVLIRFLRKVHHSLIRLTFALWGLLESVMLAVYLDTLRLPQGICEISLVIASACLAFSAQTCVTIALKHEQAGVVALVRTLEVPFCYLWQYLLLHTQTDMYSFIGAVIVTGCILVATLRNMVMSFKEDSPCRKRLAFLLY